MTSKERGLGKCTNNHVSSYGFPTRPGEPFAFCSQCGAAMVWTCTGCDISLPEDHDELLLARFCRHCGEDYFASPAEPASGETTS